MSENTISRYCPFKIPVPSSADGLEYYYKNDICNTCDSKTHVKIIYEAFKRLLAWRWKLFSMV